MVAATELICFLKKKIICSYLPILVQIYCVFFLKFRAFLKIHNISTSNT